MTDRLEVKILSTPGCAHCGEAERIFDKIKGDYPSMMVEEIDLTEQPDLAMKYSVMTAPAVVINEKVEFVGGVTEQQIREKLDEYLQ